MDDVQLACEMKDGSVIAAAFLMKMYEDEFHTVYGPCTCDPDSLHSFYKISFFFAPFSPDSFSIFAVTPSDLEALLFLSINIFCSISYKKIPGTCSPDKISFLVCSSGSEYSILTESPPALQNVAWICLYFSIFVFNS